MKKNFRADARARGVPLVVEYLIWPVILARTAIAWRMMMRKIRKELSPLLVDDLDQDTKRHLVMNGMGGSARSATVMETSR